MDLCRSCREEMAWAVSKLLTLNRDQKLVVVGLRTDWFISLWEPYFVYKQHIHYSGSDLFPLTTQAHMHASLFWRRGYGSRSPYKEHNSLHEHMPSNWVWLELYSYAYYSPNQALFRMQIEAPSGLKEDGRLVVWHPPTGTEETQCGINVTTLSWHVLILIIELQGAV